MRVVVNAMLLNCMYWWPGYLDSCFRHLAVGKTDPVRAYLLHRLDASDRRLLRYGVDGRSNQYVLFWRLCWVFKTHQVISVDLLLDLDRRRTVPAENRRIRVTF